MFGFVPDISFKFLSATSLHNCATVSHFDTVLANKALPTRESHHHHQQPQQPPQPLQPPSLPQTILFEHPSGAVGGLLESSERSHSVNDLIPHGKDSMITIGKGQRFD